MMMMIDESHALARKKVLQYYNRVQYCSSIRISLQVRTYVYILYVLSKRELPSIYLS